MELIDNKLNLVILSGLNSRSSIDGANLSPSTFIVEILKALCNLIPGNFYLGFHFNAKRLTNPLLIRRQF